MNWRLFYCMVIVLFGTCLYHTCCDGLQKKYRRIHMYIDGSNTHTLTHYTQCAHAHACTHDNTECGMKMNEKEALVT